MKFTSFFQNIISSLLLVLFVTIPTFAQDFNNYVPLESKGQIPEVFLKSMSVSYAEKRNENIKSTNKNTEKTKDQFDIVSTFHLKRLLLSGSVLFGDTVTRYVQEVGNKVLEQYPDLQGKIQFYVTKEYTINAFTTPEGFILVNLGLLAHLENEAQLAYILSHEITHYIKKHSINQYLYEQEINRENNKKGIAGWFSKSTSLYEQQAQKSSYSKEQEIEADEYGLEIFSKTKYDISEAIGAFKVLESSRYPFDTLVFKSEFLNNFYVNLPDTFYYKDTLHFIEKTELTETEKEKLRVLQTHPDIKERTKIALSKIDSNDVNQGLKYLVSEKWFELAQKIARFEMCELYLNENLFLDAIYHTLILESEYGKSNYSTFSLTKALYGMADYDLYGRRIYLEFPYNEIDWKGRNWFFALEELSDRQLGILAASHLIELSKKNKEYDYLRPFYLELLVKVLNKKNESFYEKTTYPLAIKEEDKSHDSGIMYQSWLKLKNSLDSADIAYLRLNTNPVQEKPIDNKFNFGLLDKKEVDKKQNSLPYLPNTSSLGKFEGLKSIKLDSIINNFDDKIKNMPLSNVLMIRPFAIASQDKKIQSIDLNRTDALKQQIIRTIESLKDSITINHLDFDSFTQNDVEKYNDLVFLQNWFAKTYSLEEELMPFYYQKKIQALAAKYHVDYFVMSVFVSTPKNQIILLRSQTPDSKLKRERDKIVESAYMNWKQQLLQLLSEQN